MGKKAFFRERTDREIKSLNVSRAYNQRNLVEKIDDLNPSNEGLEIRSLIIPAKFRRGNQGYEASRKCYKHGDLIRLPQPEGLDDSYGMIEIPLDLRVQAFSELQDMKQEEINFVGYSWRPVFGRNRTKRIVPFVWLSEGARIFSYAENFSRYKQRNSQTGEMEERAGIKVEAYPDAGRVRKEGASVVVEVPSRTEKKPRYKFGFLHVPYIPNNPQHERNYNLATVFSLQPALLREEGLDEMPEGRTSHAIYDIQYTFSDAREQSPVIRFTPQDIAGYLGIIKKQLTEEHNITALMFNPFALPSKHQAEFYKRLCNNVLIFDPTLSSKDKLRKLHLAEKSILLARAISHFGHDDFAYWDPTRDGIYRDYNWGVGDGR